MFSCMIVSILLLREPPISLTTIIRVPAPKGRNGSGPNQEACRNFKQKMASAAGTLPASGEGRGTAGAGRRKKTLKKIHYSDFLVHVATWNVASFTPGAPEIESMFLPQDGFMVTDDLYRSSDVIVVGLQEAYQNVQDAFTSSLPVVGRDPHVEAFSAHLASKRFVRLSFCRLLGILIMVFVKQPLLCYIHDVATCNTRTGFGGWVGNKGAVSVRFVLGDLSLCFVNCHLAAHRENNDKRILDLKDIFINQVFESKSLPSMKPMDHDVLVLFGDLNFRLEGKDFDEVSQMLEDGKYRDLLKLDQLRLEQIKGEDSPSRLCSFMEMTLDFPPSYKYEPDTDTLSGGGKGRAPAWCDRVLWYMHHRRLPKPMDMEPQSVVKPKYYCLHKQPRSSDHKPVSAGLKIFVDISDFCPPIVFHLSEWVSGVQGAIEFTVSKGTEISMWDWVGLYHYKFSSLDKDSVLWILTPAPRGPAVVDRVCSRELSADQLQLSPGRYILVYKSYEHDRVLGMSPIFPVVSLES